MSNAGFNAETDVFGLGSDWKVKDGGENGSVSVGECPNSLNDVTHRDAYADRIAPTANYELAADVTALPALGTVVAFGTRKVAINQIVVKATRGAAVSCTVSGVQVNDDATTGRTYSCGTVVLSCRHRAQDILGIIGTPTPQTLTDATFTFSCDIPLGEAKGVIHNFDVCNGRVVAQYTHTSGTGEAITAPTMTGTDSVMSAPVSKTSPENDYVTMSYSVTKSLVGSDSSAS